MKFCFGHVLFFFAFCSAPAHAVIVTYTGQAFTFTDAGGGNVTATFDFTIPLTNGAVLNETHVSTWSMSAAGRTITDSAATFFVAEFTIGPSLLPTSWAFVSEANLEGGGSPESILSLLGPESVFSNSTAATDFLSLMTWINRWLQ
jgi:hypothetical protein